MRTWIAGLLLVGALASGCGDKDDPGGATGDPAGTTTSGAAEGGTDAASGELPRFCDLLDADQLSEAVGEAVTLTTGPFDACEFDQEDPRALSGSLGATDLGAGAGGYESYQSGTGGSLSTPTRHDFDGVGDAAYVDIGTLGGGESLQVAGGALVGHVIYTLNLSPGADMTEDELVAVSEALLRLMVEAA